MNPSDPEIKKTLLRIELRKALLEMPRERRKRKSKQITEKVLRQTFFRQCQTVMIYVSTGREVETFQLIRAALTAGKKLFVPLIGKKKGSMRAVPVVDPKRDLKPGPYGILQPAAESRVRPRVKDLDVILVPGLGFDRRGGRIGRGAGYFDRFLAKYPKAVKVGLAFREQMRGRIPIAKNDVRMDLVITD